MLKFEGPMPAWVIHCDKCTDKVELTQEVRNGEIVWPLEPIQGWLVYPERLCPRCDQENTARERDLR